MNEDAKEERPEVKEEVRPPKPPSKAAAKPQEKEEPIPEQLLDISDGDYLLELSLIHI